ARFHAPVRHAGCLRHNGLPLVLEWGYNLSLQLHRQFGCPSTTFARDMTPLDAQNSYAARLQTWSKYAGAWTVTIGAVVLAGWLFNITMLKTIITGTTTTKANTSIAFILAG